jgi:hypothetical protein
MWTGLSATSGEAYKNCLNAEVLISAGLHVVVEHATESDISVRLRYIPQGSDPNPLPVSWSGLKTDSKGRPLPRTINAGWKTVVVARPAKEQQLAVNTKGYDPRW